jgi:hypothetical protein
LAAAARSTSPAPSCLRTSASSALELSRATCVFERVLCGHTGQDKPAQLPPRPEAFVLLHPPPHLQLGQCLRVRL